MLKSGVLVLAFAAIVCVAVVSVSGASDASASPLRARLLKAKPGQRLDAPPVAGAVPAPGSFPSGVLIPALVVSSNAAVASKSVMTAAAASAALLTPSDSEPLTAASTTPTTTEKADVAPAAHAAPVFVASIPSSAPSGGGVSATLLNINQCATNNGGCDSLQTCNDSPDESNSPYQCSECAPGYFSPTTGPNGEGVCYDIDECSWMNGGCGGTCTNTPGSWYCS